MVDPIVLPRADHAISRRDIDPDALKVLYRLKQFNYTAYLVGGSVRDLLLGRKPKDFDIGTSAHPYEIKRLFRNCWIIGRRFRLAHVTFGPKTIEVATFRKGVPAGTEEEPPERPEGAPAGSGRPAHDPLIHRDNTFGTAEEDAFRRDFTVNALFYDIASFSVIDYVGGLEDLRARLIRSIGNPNDRFREDPVRMIRAVALAARLGFRIDPPTYEAIRAHRAEIAHSAPPRLIEEYYKILRAGAAEATFQELAALGLLAPITPELQRGATDALWRALAAVDAYRRRFESAPDTLTNAILLGTLLVPLGLPGRPAFPRGHEGQEGDERRREPAVTLGLLPLARRDVERLRQILGLQRRLLDMGSSPRAKRAVIHRGPFREALTWLEMHGHAPDVVEHWRGFLEATTADAGPPAGEEGPPRRRRRRRRRRFGPLAP